MRLIEIFAGSKRAEMYIYVEKSSGVERVPSELLSQLGTLRSVMVMPLTPTTRLARVSAEVVLERINAQGYFLQLPPSPDALVEQQISAMIEAEEQLSQREHGQPESQGKPKSDQNEY
ncbi:MAG: YcgL domain-containing protein [Gammaproteobacteria bacterium]|nr:YcgL domain-containing protein [Gammaproteobacteria bacterium]